ncbi:MAG: M23 family metallopeptidase, partial [Candidatus Saccharimonadales bacterium]
ASSQGQATNCPNSQLGGVDYIYASQGVQVVPQSFTDIPRGVSGSDHPAKFVDVVVPGLTEASPTIAEKWLSTTVGRDEKKVNLTGIDSRGVVMVLRPTVTAPNGKWVFPLEKGGYTYAADSYGVRFLGDDDFHSGTDFGTNGATPPLVAMHGGTIVEGGYAGAWGNHLLVETGVPVPEIPGETYKYLYAHLSAYAPGLAEGDEVEAGQLVGYVGNTGNSFGEHLHLTICTTMACTSGNEEGSIDPIPFLASVGIVP